MIVLENVSLSYKDQVLLDISRLEFNSQTLNVITGHNGSGKTTLLKVLSNVYESNKGTITYDGKKWNNDLKKFISYSPSIITFETSNKVRAYLLFRASFYFPKNKRQQAVSNIIRLLKMQDIKDKSIKCLSLGETKKVLLAQALMTNSKYIFLDEPFSNLEADLKQEIILFLKEKIKNGATIIVVSHLLNDLNKCADSFTILAKGKVVFNKQITKEDLTKLFMKHKEPNE